MTASYQKQFSNLTLEPYTAPGDYDIQTLVGTRKAIPSNIKTPPGFSFNKQTRLDNSALSDNLNRSQVIVPNSLKSGNQLSSKLLLNNSSHISPGVGDYHIERVDLKDK